MAGSQLALQGVDAKDYLDIELVYRLRQKEPAVGFEDLVRETLATPYFQSNPNLLSSFLLGPTVTNLHRQPPQTLPQPHQIPIRLRQLPQRLIFLNCRLQASLWLPRRAP